MSWKEDGNFESSLDAYWSQCMAQDVVSMQGWLDAARGNGISGRKLEMLKDRVKQCIQGSIDKVERRKRGVPKVSFPAHLPVSARAEEISKVLKSHQVVVLSGETGSGKSTQLPKMCLAMGRGVRGKIGCTQPRRVAAQSLSKRVAEEMGVTWGKEVGCKIRFQDHTSPHSYIKFMTDGMLLAELQQDPMLGEYDTLIIDEAHERSLNIDFILGHLRQLMPHRPDLKLIITSATIDTQVFSDAFKQAPVLEVSGKLYPVEVIYQPVEPQAENQEEVSHVTASVHCVQEILRVHHSGDILVFMPSESDIKETIARLEGKKPRGFECLPLYGRLAGADQQRIFQGGGLRRVVVATNIAETSLTLPGIRFVVDTGLARVSRYSPSTHTRRLPIEPIAQSNANQRKGRCGRVQEGICFRLYSQEDFEQRAAFLAPEIQRCNLAEVILKMKAHGLGDMETFPFIQPPRPAAIKAGYKLLQELGAIDTKLELTDLGKKLACLPLDPTIGRMILQGAQEGVLDEIIIIAAGMSVQDPRERPSEAASEADAAHQRFRHSNSDFLTLLKLWEFCFENENLGGKSNQIRKQCRTHFIHYLRMREWRDIHHQIWSVIKADTQLIVQQHQAFEPDRFQDPRWYAAIHRSILAGLLSQCAHSLERQTYQTASGRQAYLFPGSVLYQRGPKEGGKPTRPDKAQVKGRDKGWVVAGELVETSRTFIRMVATIKPQWIIHLGKHLCKVSYLNPRWDSAKGKVVCTEVTRLNGIEVIARQADFGQAQPIAAREIFIREGLVGERDRWDIPFLNHNNQVIQEASLRLTRIRHGHYLNLDDQLSEFYQKHLPEQITSMGALRHYLKGGGGQAHNLCMPVEVLMPKGYQRGEDHEFPSTLLIEGKQVKVAYAYAPGEENDGVTLEIPSGLASKINEASLLWMIPGNREDLIHHLFRGLGKESRRRLMPLNDRARAAAVVIKDATGETFLDKLGEWLVNRFEIQLDRGDWDLKSLPKHLKPRIKVLDDLGKTLYQGRELAQVHGETSKPQTSDAQPALEKALQRWEEEDLRGWTFEDPPEKILIGSHNGHPSYVFPGLLRQEGQLSLKLFHKAQEARNATQAAWPHLCALDFDRELGWWQRDLQGSRVLEDVRLLYMPFGSPEVFATQAYHSMLNHLFACEACYPLQRLHYDRAREVARARMMGLWAESLELWPGILQARQNLLMQSSAYAGMKEDIQSLFPDQWLLRIPYQRLKHYPRYLKAMEIRANRAQSNSIRDREKAERLIPWIKALAEAYHQLTPGESRWNQWTELRWMIEEFRVSLFAQELGTSIPVSEKRLGKLLKELSRKG